MIFKRIKSIFVETFLSSTIHGIPNILKNENKIIVSLMWTVFFLTGAIFCSYSVTLSILNYFKYEVITTIKVVNEFPSLFPTVTICNLNGWNEGYYFNEMILFCRFNNLECNTSYFDHVYTSQFGNCYRFNGNSRKEKYYSYVPGKFEGLIVDLFSGVQSTNQTLSPGYGFHIYIHNETDLTDRIIKGVDVSPGFQTNLVVERIFYEKLPLPYEDCFMDLDTSKYYDQFLIRKILNEKNVYQQNVCFEYCRTNLLKEKCNCESIYGEYYQCKNSNYNQSCVNNLNINFYINLFKECFKYCPLECNTQEFRITTSFLDYPHLSKMNQFVSNPVIYSKFNNQNITVSDIKKTILSIAIYYDDLKYTIIGKEPKVTILSLISDIGGVMGVFIGASFLSFVEIFEFILKAFLVN